MSYEAFRLMVQGWASSGYLPEALAYCASVDYLNAREELHDRLKAQGLAVLDAHPSDLGADLVTRYLGWKKGGVL